MRSAAPRGRPVLVSPGTGSISPVSPPRWRKRLAPEQAAAPAAPQRRRPASGRCGGRAGARVGGLVDGHVGDHGRDVVGAAGVERGPDQLHGGVVDRTGAEDVGDPGVVEDAGAAVAAQQDPVAGGEVDVEQVRVGLVHPVHRPQDQVAVRVGAGLLLGDPAVVDEALDEGVVLRQPAQRPLAQQVAPAVPDVADGDLGPVEERGGDRRTGAVELGVLVDELGEPVVGAVDRARHRLAACPAEAARRGGAGSAPPCCSRCRRARPRPPRRRPSAGADRRTRSPGCSSGRGRRRTGRRTGGSAESDPCGRRYFLSSRVVLPIRIWVPRETVVGWVSREEPM